MTNLATIPTKNKGFNLAPQDIGQAMQLATMMANSQLSPQNFRGKPEDTLIAMMMGSELGLNPMQSIQNIAVINGRPCLWGDSMLALVQNHPAFGGIEETFNDSTMTAKCVVWRKNGGKHEQTFSQADAQTAGLLNKGPWKQYPKRMLAMRARGFALRNQFADALAGLVTAEEAYDMPATDQPYEPEEKATLDAEQLETLNALLTETGSNVEGFCKYFSIGAVDGLPVERFEEARSMLKAKAAKNDHS